jgi:hypothetical protein
MTSSKFDTVPAAANDAHTTFPPFSATRYAAIIDSEVKLGALRSSKADIDRAKLWGLESES